MPELPVSCQLFRRVTSFARKRHLSLHACTDLITRTGMRDIGRETRMKNCPRLTKEEQAVVRELFTKKSLTDIARVIGKRQKYVKSFWSGLVLGHIRKHWRTDSDEAIARAVKWKRYQVMGLRLSHNLDHERGYRVDASDLEHARARIDPIETKALLTSGGKTQAELIKHFGLSITPQRLSQLLFDLGCHVYPTCRTTGWYAKRYQMPELADKAKLLRWFAGCRSHTELVERICRNGGIKPYVLRRVLTLHGIVPRVRQKVTLICSNPLCKETFTRLVSLTKEAEHPSCNKECSMVFMAFRRVENGHGGDPNAHKTIRAFKLAHPKRR